LWNDYYFQSWFSFGNNNGRRIKLDKQGYSTGVKDDFFKPVTAENVACTVHYHFESKKTKTEKAAEEKSPSAKDSTSPSRRLMPGMKMKMCKGKPDTECMHRNLDVDTKDN